MACAALLLSICAFAQEKGNDEVDYPEYDQLNVKPSFNGGDKDEFTKWVNKRLVYPQSAIERGAEGMVAFRLVIDERGFLSEIELLGMPDRDLAMEAMRVMTMSPRWTPAIVDGTPVKSEFKFSVQFMLKGKLTDPKKGRIDRMSKSSKDPKRHRSSRSGAGKLR